MYTNNLFGPAEVMFEIYINLTTLKIKYAALLLCKKLIF